jgi:predicted naringenin-chalcone synthase
MDSLYLHDLICPPCRFEKSQDESLVWLRKAYRKYQKDHTSEEADYERLLKRVGLNPSQISKRGYYLPDFHSDFADNSIFQESKVQGLSQRQDQFQKITNQIFSSLYENRKLPEHLIHVTCTGYKSPSAAQMIAAEESPDCTVTHSYHMGCYGAFPALRMGQGFVRLNPQQCVDVVHTELCTLHLNPIDPSLEQMLVQSLFADGVAAYRISSRKPSLGFEFLHQTEFVVPKTQDAMEWDLSEMGFVMKLSKDIPGLIATHLKGSIEKWEVQSGLFLRGLLKDCIVAVHPGGPKIVDFVKSSLELHEDQVSYSRKVLFEYGNMSSATVPHIWQEILNDPNVPGGTLVLSMAFGPGLTLAMNLMRVLR